MSGIFGIIHLDGRPVDVADLERMRQTMAHRGPDGSAIWRDGGAGLGQLMLHTTPESLTETLPWKDAESGLVITADARIDNREELAAKLGSFVGARLAGDSPHSPVGARLAGDRADPHSAIPDSQFILEAYKRWGDACVDHLLGDFAFVIWNSRSRELFCARDHMGIRPFYYFHSGLTFVFGSAAIAVAVVGAVPFLPDEARMADILVPELEGIDFTSSFFCNVSRLPAAHIGVLKRQNFSPRKYWQPDPIRELSLGGDDEYIDGLQHVLTASVQARMRCHLPTASMLSGGVDSTTLAAIAARLQHAAGGGGYRTYSGISSSTAACTESRYILAAVADGAFDARYVQTDQLDQYMQALQGLHTVMEDPFDLPWHLLQSLYQRAGSDGYVTLMDGTDGEGVAGLSKSYPLQLIRQGKLITAVSEINGQCKHFFRVESSLWPFFRYALRIALMPGFIQRMRRNVHESRWFEQAVRQAHLQRGFAEQVQLSERYRRYREHSPSGMLSTIRKTHAQRLGVSYLVAGIERYNRLASYFGLEQRSPLLDRRVVEYCLALPWYIKARDGWTKYGLRKVTERLGQGTVAWRPGWEALGWNFTRAVEVHQRQENLQLIGDHEQELRQRLTPDFFADVLEIQDADPADALGSVLNVVGYIRWNQRMSSLAKQRTDNSLNSGGMRDF